MLEKRARSVLVIQKWVRGHQGRLRYRRMKDDARYIRKLRRFLSVSLKRLRSNLVKRLVVVLRKSGRKCQEDRAQLMKKYLGMCATII